MHSDIESMIGGLAGIVWKGNVSLDYVLVFEFLPLLC